MKILKSLALGVCALTLSSCASTPQTYDFDNSREVAADFDATWEGVIAYFAENNIPIATVEKDSGLIVATDERLASDNLKKLADCGGGIGGTPVTSQMSVNVFVRRKDLEVTSVQVNTRFSGTGVGLMNTTFQIDCNSNGTLETALLDRIEAKAAP